MQSSHLKLQGVKICIDVQHTFDRMIKIHFSYLVRWYSPSHSVRLNSLVQQPCMALLNQSENWRNCNEQRKTSLQNKKLETNNKVTDIW